MRSKPKPCQAADNQELCSNGSCSDWRCMYWRCITGRPLAEPPFLEYKGMTAGRLGPIKWFNAGASEGEIDGWVSDERLRRLFGKNIELGYEWRDECTEMTLTDNYRDWAFQMQKVETTHERRKFFHFLHAELDDWDLKEDTRAMEKAMEKGRKSGVVTNLGIWEFEHLDEDDAMWYWWGQDLYERDKERRRCEKIGEQFEAAVFQWEMDELAIVQPSFRLGPPYMTESGGEDMQQFEYEMFDYVDHEAKAAKELEKQIKECYRDQAQYGKPISNLYWVPERMRNLIAAREMAAVEPFLQETDHKLEVYKMFGRRESVVLQYLDLKTPKKDEPARSEEEIKEWLVGKLEEHRAEMKLVGDAQEKIRVAYAKKEYEEYLVLRVAKKAAKEAAKKSFGQLVVERAKAWVPFL